VGFEGIDDLGKQDQKQTSSVWATATNTSARQVESSGQLPPKSSHL
jgi:hypothetical protein